MNRIPFGEDPKEKKSEEQKNREKKTRKAGLMIGLAFLVLAVVLFLNRTGKFKNRILLSKSPEEYYAYVEENNISGFNNLLLAFYEKDFEILSSKKALSEEKKLTLSYNGKMFAEDILPEFGLAEKGSYSGYVKRDSDSFDISLSNDTDNDETYELYYAEDDNMLTLSGFGKTVHSVLKPSGLSFGELTSLKISPKNALKLLKKYEKELICLIVENSKISIKKNSYTQIGNAVGFQNRITVEMKKEELLATLDALFVKFSGDEQLSKYYGDGKDSDPSYKEYLEEIRNGLKEKLSDIENVTMHVNVNDKGVITGREAEIKREDSDEYIKTGLVSVTLNGITSYELYLEKDDKSFMLQGTYSGKEVFSGEADLTVSDGPETESFHIGYIDTRIIEPENFKVTGDLNITSEAFKDVKLYLSFAASSEKEEIEFFAVYGGVVQFEAKAIIED